VGKLPIRLVRRLDDGGSVVVWDHPLLVLLRKPNAWQTRLEFIEMVAGEHRAMLHLLLTGFGEPISTT
jgi:phage portal protein BeeE